LIFFAINSKAVTQLSDEIDAKGVRLVKTLASIDAPLWKAAIQPDAANRKRKIEFLAQKFNPEMNAAARENLFRQNPELKTMVDQLVDPLGPLHPLKSDKRDIGPGSDILQITVVDTEAGSVQAVDGYGEKGINV